MITDISFFQNCLILQGGIEMFEGVTKEFGPDLGGKKQGKKRSIKNDVTASVNGTLRELL